MPETPENNRRAMVVVAHADDAEFGCSGTVARWCHEGWDVIYVLCTDGSKGSGDTKTSSEKLSTTRRDEQLAAAKVLGLKDVIFLGYEDGVLEPTLNLRRDIAREIRRYRPEVLITLNPSRNLDGEWGVGHPDHMAAGEAALSAVYPSARDHLAFPELLEEGLDPHKVNEVWIIGHPDPNHWVDITDHVDRANRALAQHSSQISNRGEMAKVMNERRRKNAADKSMQYAERFRRIIVDRP